MNPKIEIQSLLISKLKTDCASVVKYDIEAALDEIENIETEVKLKYKFTLLSNPTNAKINVEGFATIYGNESEIAKQLSPDERNIPQVVNLIYQEIFPFFYIISKTMQIPCPAYRLSQISTSHQIEQPVMTESITNHVAEPIANPISETATISETAQPNPAEIPKEVIESERPKEPEQIVEEPRM